MSFPLPSLPMLGHLCAECRDQALEVSAAILSTLVYGIAWFIWDIKQASIVGLAQLAAC